MKWGATLENLAAAIVESCQSGLSPEALRDQVLARLRTVVPFDAAFWATVDPTTLLQTRPHQVGIPAETIPYFIQNEFFDTDVNKWTGLAADRLGVRTLAQPTGGEMEASPRYRDVFQPLGFGDELRAVFRVGCTCWGYMCLHREAGAPFSRQEVAYVHRLAPRVAEGIRAGILIASTELASVADSPGLVLLASDGSLLSATEAGERWLEQLADPVYKGSAIPIPVLTLAARLHSADAPEGGLPKLRVQTRAGRWAVLHASRMTTSGTDAVAVIIDEPSPAELVPVILMAYCLTKQEQVLTALVCRGLSTSAIAARLHITPNTIQEHLKSIFEKTGAS